MKRPAAMLGATAKKAAKQAARGSKVAKPGFLQSLEDNKIPDVVMHRPAGAVVAYSDTEMQKEIRNKKRALDIAMQRHDDGIDLLPDHVVEAYKSAGKQRVGKQKAIRDVVLQGIEQAKDGSSRIVVQCPVFEDCVNILCGGPFCYV